ncbi:MAG: hypothetical protein CO187_01210 [Zetaproteobacteria bacterium CG_4_9_14_3_um_filter_53_7]|nr:MAG: hypothetical protein CO187_01210 [Zetaproteobacteria bacterium CG_4_9_14_3_um_filter_53_7]
MNSSLKTNPSEESRILLDTLKTAVTQALEKKRRLGQYAVIWKNGKPDRLGADPTAAESERA